jgi:hypothetical protein
LWKSFLFYFIKCVPFYQTIWFQIHVFFPGYHEYFHDNHISWLERVVSSFNIISCASLISFRIVPLFVVCNLQDFHLFCWSNLSHFMISFAYFL